MLWFDEKSSISNLGDEIVYNLELFWKNFGEIHVEAVLEDAAACLQGGLCQHSQPEVLILRLETKVY